MRDVDRALADIADIRSRLAVGSMFRGLGPAVIGATGLLAIAVGAAQSFWPVALAPDAATYLLVWIGAAVVAGVAVAVEMVARSRRHHGGMADGDDPERHRNNSRRRRRGGFVVSMVLMRFAPDALWLVPGIWQICMAVGVFASVRLLPWSMSLAAAWYFLAGVAVLIVASETRALAPWMMAVPFAVGQLGMALVLHLADENDDV